MARDIKDSIVIKRCSAEGFDTVYIDNIPMYEGKVKESIDKIRLEQSQFGLRREAIVKELNDKYESLKIEDARCRLIIEEKEITVTKEQLRMLKALAVEQINRNREYSDIVAYVFIQLAMSLAANKVTCDFRPYEDATVMQKIVQEAMQDYIAKKLDISRSNAVKELEVQYDV